MPNVDTIEVKVLVLSLLCLFQEGAALANILPRMSAGASSFGMSGVNAHGLFASPNTLIRQVSSLNWERGRYWMSPPNYCLLVEANQRQTAQCRCCTSCL